MPNKHKEQQSIEYRAYLVAYFDILGQRDKLSKLATPPIEDDQKKINEYIQQVRQIYDHITSFRTDIVNHIELFSKSGVEDKEIPELQKTLLNKLRAHSTKSYPFSDCIMIHIQLSNDEIQWAGRAIFGVLCATAVIFNSFLARNIPIRGGIDVGFALNIGPNEIYGPVLASAVYLESKVAEYPRVVIGQHLHNYLTELATMDSKSDESIVNQILAKKCLSLIAKDSDGRLIVDHLGDYIRDVLQRGNCKFDYVLDAYNIACKQYDHFEDAHNAANLIGNDNQSKNCLKLMKRYARLMKYYENNLPKWKMT
jgi:hypothetical protein